MSKTLDSFYPWLAPLVPGCSDPLLNQAIRSACIDFCTRTDLVQTVIATTVSSGTATYTITPPTDMQLARILSVSWQNIPLLPVSPDLVADGVLLQGAPIGSAQLTAGQPRYFYQKTVSDTGFTLYPVPDTTVPTGLTIKCSWTPANTATTVDDILFDDWVDDIAAGAAATLMSMPGQPFSSSNSRMYAMGFKDAVSRAKRVKNEGYLPGTLRVQPVRFA